MSYHKIKEIDFAPYIVRDFYQPYSKSANFTVDLFQEFLVIGLDIMIHNRGASSLTVSLDKGDPITVEAGDTFSMSNIKFCLIEVVSTVTFDMVVAGRHISKDQLARVK